MYKIDYILSSVRPFKDSPSYAAMQSLAIASWQVLGSKVVLFSPQEAAHSLAPGVQFVLPKNDPPRISEMLAWAVEHTSENAIIALCNSDIILLVDLNKLAQLVETNNMTRSWAATSFRYTFNFTDGLGRAYQRQGDYGLDIFIAPHRIWKMVLSEMKELGADRLSMGRILWDNFLNSYFRSRMPIHRYLDLTPWKVVFHPEHEDRNRHEEYDQDLVSHLQFLSSGGIPPTRYALP